MVFVPVGLPLEEDIPHIRLLHIAAQEDAVFVN